MAKLTGSTGRSSPRLFLSGWQEGECVCPLSVEVGTPDSAPTPPAGCQGSLQGPGTPWCSLVEEEGRDAHVASRRILDREMLS